MECRCVAVQWGKQDQNDLKHETHTNNFILNTFWNRKPVHFFQKMRSLGDKVPREWDFQHVFFHVQIFSYKLLFNFYAQWITN